MNTDIQGAVIIIGNAVVDYSIPFTNDKEAESNFLAVCKENISNFDEYSKDDIEYLLDNGYATFDFNNSICIHWFDWE